MFSETAYFRDIAMAPVESHKVVKTFEKFGPNFEVNLGIIVKAIPSQWSGIFTLTNDDSKKRDYLGARYPVVTGRSVSGQNAFYIETCFYETNEYAIRAGEPHRVWGHCSNSEPLPFNELIDLTYQYQDGIMKMFINQELFWNVDTKNEHPYVIENMKLILGQGSKPIDGSISYFALRADNGMNGKSKHYAKHF